MRAAILADGRAWKNWVTGSSFTRRGLVSRTATRIYHAENLRRLSKIAFRRAKNLEREEVEEGGALERVHGEKILSRIGDKMKIGERNTTKVKIAGQNNFRVVLMASKGLKKYDWPIFGQFFPLEFVFNDNDNGGWMIGARSFLNEAVNIRNTC